MSDKARMLKVRAALESLPDAVAGHVAQAGWFPSAKYEDGTPVAYVAAIQEFGSPANGIPPRTFIRTTIATRKAEWVEATKAMLREVVRGGLQPEQVLERLALQMQSDLQLAIEQGDFEPLSPVTLMLRKWRREGREITGRTVGEAAAAVASGEDYSGAPTDPLRDTGLLIATISSGVGKEQ